MFEFLLDGEYRLLPTDVGGGDLFDQLQSKTLDHGHTASPLARDLPEKLIF